MMCGQDYHTWGNIGPLSVRRFDTPETADLLVEGLLTAQVDLETAIRALSPFGQA